MKKCIVCGEPTPDSRDVCFDCEEHARRYGLPFGWMSVCDVQEVTGLRGLQLGKMMEEYGTQIGGKACIAADRFKLLYATGKLNKFRQYRMYSKRLKKGLKADYVRQVG